MRRNPAWWAMLIGIAGIAGGCGGGGGGGDAGADGGGDAATDDDFAYPITGVAAEWFPCSFIDGADDGLGECSSTPMPLFWDAPDGRTIEIYAKRRLAAAQPAPAQIWFLDGGPGASGCEGRPPMMDKLQALLPEIDVYTIDHRGVGGSARLSCPTDDWGHAGDFEACVEYLGEELGDELHAYSTSFSAIDVAAYIEATRAPGQRVFVWGGSYGTYIAQRYAAIFPDQADGIVLEGNCTADDTFVWFDEGMDRAGKMLIEACASDPYCGGKYGKDPLGRIESLYQQIYWPSYCPELEDLRYYVPYMASYMLYYHPYHNAVPALLYRAMRCGAADVDALWHAAGMLFGDDSTFMDLGDGYSGVLYKNVVYSEMWAHPDYPTDDALADYAASVYADSIFGLGSVDSVMAEHAEYKQWSKYEDATWDDRWAETETPMLILQGLLDPATSYYHAAELRDRFDAPHQTFVTFPTAAHNVTSGTPVSEDPEATTCGRQLFVAFLRDPTADLDLACVDQVLPNDFEGDPTLADLVFGTEHMWEDGAGKGPAAHPVPPADWIGALAELRARVRRDLPTAARDLGLE